MKTKILITGAAGGLGRAVHSSFLKSEDFQLFCPTRDEFDLLNLTKINNYYSKIQPDIVIHLAALVYGLKGNLDNAYSALSANTLINHNLFEMINRYGCKKIFFASTAACYGYPFDSPNLNESKLFINLPHKGEFGYAMAKRHAYSYLRIFKDSFGIDFIYGIFTNMFGRYDKFDTEHGHVIPSLVAKAHKAHANNIPFEIWGSPNSVRDFIDFNTAAEAILYLIKQKDVPELINISTGVGTSIETVVKVISSYFGITNFVYNENMPVGIPHRILDNTRLNEIGFNTSFNIQEKLIDLCEWYSSSRG